MALVDASRTDIHNSYNLSTRSNAAATNTTVSNKSFNPVFTPVNNIDLVQNDSSQGKSNSQTATPKVDIAASPVTNGGAATASNNKPIAQMINNRASSVNFLLPSIDRPVPRSLWDMG